jgi:hypothetical protein
MRHDGRVPAAAHTSPSAGAICAAVEAAMAGTKVFRLWLMDQLRTNENGRWDANVRQTIEDTLRGHFQKVLASQMCAFGKIEITWEGIAFLRAQHGYADTDIVLHFLDSVRESILRNRFGVSLKSGSGHSGATQLTPEGMLSEIHVWDNDNGTEFRLGKLIGNLAFHEAMHNKLDADPRFSGDIHALHTNPVGGLSEPVISAKSDLKSDELLRMAPAMARVIPQF